MSRGQNITPLLRYGATETLEEIIVVIQALATSVAELQLRATVHAIVYGRIYPPEPLVFS